MNPTKKCWWCQNSVVESTTANYVKNCLALKWVAQGKSGVPEKEITYHPHRHVCHFIKEGWEVMRRKEEERRKGREADERRRERQREEEKRRRAERRKREEAARKTEEHLFYVAAAAMSFITVDN